MISPCQGRHGKYLKNYSRKFHVGVLVSTWDLWHFVMPRISLCISESVCFRQSGTVPGSSRSELSYELPLASLLQIAQRGLALFLVFPYPAAKTPHGYPFHPSDLLVRSFGGKILLRSGKHPIGCLFPFGHEKSP